MKHTMEAPDLEHGLSLVDRLTPDDDKDVTRGREELDDLIDYVCGSVGDVVRATPRAQTGLTVQAALVHLKELTPHRCEISFFTSGQVAITVFANSIIPMGLFRTLKSTLDEAVNDVRAWAKSRAEREGERT